MTRYDLETTYLALDGVGGVTAMPGGAEFWRTIDKNPTAGGTLVTLMGGEGDWPHWEMHPVGDEVLVLLEGEATVIFEVGDTAERHPMTKGSMLVVPRGVWHRGVDQRGMKMLFMTYGEGTSHKPVTNEDLARAARAVAA